jgi:hypothetical protein
MALVLLVQGGAEVGISSLSSGCTNPTEIAGMLTILLLTKFVVEVNNTIKPLQDTTLGMVRRPACGSRRGVLFDRFLAFLNQEKIRHRTSRFGASC